jgi:hypothetical protein
MIKYPLQRWDCADGDQAGSGNNETKIIFLLNRASVVMTHFVKSLFSVLAYRRAGLLGSWMARWLGCWMARQLGCYRRESCALQVKERNKLRATEKISASVKINGNFKIRNTIKGNND